MSTLVELEKAAESSRPLMRSRPHRFDEETVQSFRDFCRGSLGPVVW